jgi:hypothetical protein
LALFGWDVGCFPRREFFFDFGAVADNFAIDEDVAMAIRSLADESRCLSLMSRYEFSIHKAANAPCSHAAEVN